MTRTKGELRNTPSTPSHPADVSSGDIKGKSSNTPITPSPDVKRQEATPGGINTTPSNDSSDTCHYSTPRVTPDDNKYTIGSKLSQHQADQLISLLQRNHNSFVGKEKDIGKAIGVQHRIDLKKGYKVSTGKRYRLNPHMSARVRKPIVFASPSRIRPKTILYGH